MKTALLIIALFGTLGLAVWFAFSAWSMMPGVEMSGHGYFAMYLGIFVTLAVGVGLMGLVFYSSRRGYDDAADWGAPKHGKREDGD